MLSFFVTNRLARMTAIQIRVLISKQIQWLTDSQLYWIFRKELA